MTITFKGFNVHPGYAKGRMVSAIKLASEFVHRLPRHGLSPETTEGYEGYVHPHDDTGRCRTCRRQTAVTRFHSQGAG